MGGLTDLACDTIIVLRAIRRTQKKNIRANVSSTLVFSYPWPVESSKKDKKEMVVKGSTGI